MGFVDGQKAHECVVQFAGSGFGVARIEGGQFVACHAGPRGGVLVYASVAAAERAMFEPGRRWRPWRRRMDHDAAQVLTSEGVESCSGGLVHTPCGTSLAPSESVS